jgi:hypothetical protein
MQPDSTTYLPEPEEKRTFNEDNLLPAFDDE